MAQYYLSPLSTNIQFFTNTGVILAGGLIGTFIAGTSTPQATFTDSTGITPNPNPIILNSAGRLPGSGELWVAAGTALKLVITDATSSPITTLDNVASLNDPSAAGSSGQFVGTLTGFSGTVSGNVKYTVSGNIVSLSTSIVGTSNSISMTMTGLPAALSPRTSNQFVPCILEDNGNPTIGGWAQVQSGLIVFATGFNPVQAGFTGSNGKGLPPGWAIVYSLI